MASPSRRSKPDLPRTSSKTKPQPSSSSEGGGERKERESKGPTLKKAKKEKAIKTARGGDIESRGSSVVDDLELTDSLSTGEFPSDITFR